VSRTHGVAATYREGGCRCDLCRKANTAACVSERKTRTARAAADPTLVVHGRAATYTNWGCRCMPCTAANSERCASYKQAERGAR
jgi:hypothetical protein